MGDEAPGGEAPVIFDDVLALLHREVGLYRRILQLCEEEQALLLGGGGDALINLLGELQVAVNTLHQVSRRRMSLAGRLGIHWNGEGQEWKQEQSQAQHQDGRAQAQGQAQARDMAGALKAFTEIIQLVAKIAEVNRANERLIQGSLEYISFLDNYVGDGPELLRMIYAAGESRICDQHSLDWKR
ncbi:MAG: hypothetical protein HPY71_10065 [Firmicutes bacterium]|nr:hypothetical protein [Bacillota bacterium]